MTENERDREDPGPDMESDPIYTGEAEPELVLVRWGDPELKPGGWDAPKPKKLVSRQN